MYIIFPDQGYHVHDQFDYTYTILYMTIKNTQLYQKTKLYASLQVYLLCYPIYI